MITLKKGNLTLLLFPHLTRYKELIHAITTRDGGVSSNVYESLNLSFRVGDSQDSVMKNYQELGRALNFDLGSLVTCQQVHRDGIALVEGSYLARNCSLPFRSIPDKDALVTNVPGITLMAQFADCVPLLFYHPQTHTIAVVHAGWKGTLARIAQKTVHVLVTHYHCHPHQIQAAIGPSIGTCCYQISDAMAAKAVEELPEAQKCLRESSDGRVYFNLQEANKQQLASEGVQDSQIFCSHLCTSCTHDLFFSYRRDKKITGRFGALIGLRAPEL
jgi:YfiH family protein